MCTCARENNGEKDAWNPENKSRSQHKNVRGFLLLNVFWNFIRATSLEILKVAEPATLSCRIALYEPFFFVNKQINTCLTQKWFTDLPRVQMPCAKPFLLGASWPCLSLASREHSRTCNHMLKRSKKPITSHHFNTIYQLQRTEIHIFAERSPGLWVMKLYFLRLIRHSKYWARNWLFTSYEWW